MVVSAIADVAHSDNADVAILLFFVNFGIPPLSFDVYRSRRKGFPRHFVMNCIAIIYWPHRFRYQQLGLCPEAWMRFQQHITRLPSHKPRLENNKKRAESELRSLSRPTCVEEGSDSTFWPCACFPAALLLILLRDCDLRVRVSSLCTQTLSPIKVLLCHWNSLIPIASFKNKRCYDPSFLTPVGGPDILVLFLP